MPDCAMVGCRCSPTRGDSSFMPIATGRYTKVNAVHWNSTIINYKCSQRAQCYLGGRLGNYSSCCGCGNSNLSRKLSSRLHITKKNGVL